MAFVRLLSAAVYGGRSHRPGTILEVDADTSTNLIGRGDAEAAPLAEQAGPDVVRLPVAADEPELSVSLDESGLMAILNGTVGGVQGKVDAMTDAALLGALSALEGAGANRKGVQTAIAARLAALNALETAKVAGGTENAMQPPADAP